MMPIEEGSFNYLRDEIPEFWNNSIMLGRQQGIPYPWQSLELQLPNFKKKSTYEKEEFDFQYPPGEWITPEDLGMTAEETCRGIYLDLQHDTPKDVKIDSSHIISIGIGKNTEYLR